MGEVHADSTFNYMTELVRNVQPGEEVVISGISGAFPNAENVHELSENLFNKFKIPDKNRWETFTHPEMPTRVGIVPNVEKYDAGYFGLQAREVNSMQSSGRILHEKAIEAIMDAGLNPSDLENTNTGVYVGTLVTLQVIVPGLFSITGNEHSMNAHRLSYFLKLRGPSMVADTACSSSVTALENAFRALMLGEIDNAIVAGINICMDPIVHLEFAKLGVLCLDGTCKSFDKAANGYLRSEAISVIFLQKLKNAKRSYARIIHLRSNCDGAKEQGITYPSGASQRLLLSEIYEECKVSPENLSYLEAHGTGTTVGDPEECVAIDAVLTENRKLPLLVGSVKSNIGHSEPASGLSSIIKCILAFETGFIPPNIHYTTPKDELRGIVEGRMKIVVDATRFDDNRGLAGVNNFGFGGSNCHLILRWNTKEQTNTILTTSDILPRLVCVSGRTKNAVTTLLEELRNNEFDAEHVYLLHNVFRKNIQNHTYRGYIIVSKSTGELHRSLRYFSGDNIPLYFTFGKLNNWSEIGNDLMVVPAFAASIQRIQKLLLDIDMSNIFLNNSDGKERNCVLGSVAVQIGIIDTLNLLGVRPTWCMGFSFGVLSAAYCDGSLNLEETIKCALVINDYSDTMLSKSNGDNIGQVNQQIANGNTVLNDTNFDNLLLNLEAHNSNNIPTLLRESLSRILDNKNICSEKTKNKFRSADYLINAVTNVSQESERIKLPSVVFEISSKQCYENVKDVSVISFTAARRTNYVAAFLEDLGSLYECGYNPQMKELYPTVDLPVSRGTRMISPYIKWNHNKDWYIPQHDAFPREEICTRRIFKLTQKDWTFLAGHVLDGRNLFPATGFLYMVWETVAFIKNSTFMVTDVLFEDCKFIRAVTNSNKPEIKFTVTIQRDTGKFEVIEGESVVATGRVRHTFYEPENTTSYQPTSSPNTVVRPLQKREVYKELRLRGYNYRDEFCAIQNCDTTASSAHIQWKNNWITFMDNMLQMKALELDTRSLYVATYIRKLTIEPRKHLAWINRYYGSADDSLCLPVLNDQYTGILSCGYIKIWGVTARAISKRKYLGIPVLETYKFIPNVANLEIHVSVRVIMQIILENMLTNKIKVVELIDDYSEDDPTLSPFILAVLEDQPLVQPSVKILSKTPLDISNVKVEDTQLSTETDCALVIGTNLLGRSKILKEAFQALKEKGFLISRESRDFEISSTNRFDIEVITLHKTATDSLVLFQKLSPLRKSVILQIDLSSQFSWIPELKETIEKKSNADIVIYSKNEANSGILGLVNCLRREPSGGIIRCMFIMDTNEKLVPSKQQITAQLRKNMAFNVYKNGQWGTYRHVLLTQLTEVESEHSWANISTIGDLSTIRWVEGPLRPSKVHAVGNIAYIHYAALNFKDVMLATGKIDGSIMHQTRIEQESLGFEYSGRDINGNRIMGVTVSGALSTSVRIHSDLSFNVPDAWSLDEAATVPIVYLTVLYAFHVRGEMKRGESVLIHSGTGGVGLAAIRMALHYGCTVFTTVGTQEKREFLKETFPQLKDDHIGNSRDESFEQMVYKGTNGRGVDMVLNSLIEDKLFASVRCLATGGRFLEIGKYDMGNNNKLNLLLLKKQASYHGIMVDMFFKSTPHKKMLLYNLMNEGIQSGAIQPLKRTIFKYNEVEQAFRFMASGKHMGKVLIEIRNTENDIAYTPTQKFLCFPSGNRIMGVTVSGALSTSVRIHSDLSFNVPDAWSLDEAATVPIVYLTVLYAFHVRGEMKRGESVLIHSGTGGVGLAAIRMALHYGCTVFTTVGTQEKREFLKETFPQLKDDHIGNSRDESFEQMVYKGTNGRGVDMVLNSLIEDKLFASVRCLATGGRFLEIGKYDMGNNNKLNLLLLKKQASYHGIMVDMFFKSTPHKKMLLYNLMNEGIQSGAIQPLKRTIFKYNEVEQAFRFMASGKHMGKVLIEIRNTENDIAYTPTQKFLCFPRFSCDPEMVYIIAGGLGGFGLELADWLVLRGAIKLVLSSRKGVSTEYQHYRIRIWQSHGIVVKISTSDITTKSGCQELIEESQELGPIDAIFNLAVVLKDCIFENQTAESFCTAFGPKALATQYLDELSRKCCPSLRQFVIFSSLSCGRGNAGQTNYGMANSVMERICEHRKRDGYPALAIQWGAVGQVGLVAEMQEEHIELAIGGTLQQRISNCLQVLDSFLQQPDEVIVSSMVVAEKQAGAGTAKTIMEAVVNILGIDIKTVSVHSTLAELGMDSMTAMEIKQILEIDFDVVLSAKDMRTMTLTRLKEIQTEKEATDQEVVNVSHTKFGLDTIFRLIGPECESRLHYKRLKSNIKESTSAPTLIMFPGIEGFTTVYQQLAVHLNAHAVCVQYTCFDNTTISCTVNSLIPIIEEFITKREPFKFIAYSYGVIIALEVVGILESKGYTGSIICLDGSPSLFKEMSESINSASDEELQSTVVYQIISLFSLKNIDSDYKKKIFRCKNWEERLDLLIEVIKDIPQSSESYKREVTNGLFKRLTDLTTYEPSYGKLKTIAKLFKAERTSIQGFSDDYEISNLFESPVEVQTFAGDHTTLLDNELLVETINLFIGNY